MSNRPRSVFCFILAGAFLALLSCSLGAAAEPPERGLTVHFDFFNSAPEAQVLLQKSLALGVSILNVVPPPHIWEHPQDLAILRQIFAFAYRHGQRVVLTRIDASATAKENWLRSNYLYTHILNQPGRLPDGRATPPFFLATVANPAYERWMEEETRYYSREFAQEPALAAFSCGLLNEPFVSQRGGLLCFDEQTRRYEIGQYTPFMREFWGGYLRRAFGGDLSAMNYFFVTSFREFAAVPMPRSEHDPAFGRPDRAYRNFCRALNHWVSRQITGLAKIWRSGGGRNVPLVLQLSGYVEEKLQLGSPTLSEFDLNGWIAKVDILGLSLYTDSGYPDRGHHSVAAMTDRAAAIARTGKPVWVLECGVEDRGARADLRELDFLAGQIRRIPPRVLVYEFTREAYNETAPFRDGKLFDQAGRFRPAAARAALRLWLRAGAGKKIKAP